MVLGELQRLSLTFSSFSSDIDSIKLGELQKLSLTVFKTQKFSNFSKIKFKKNASIQQFFKNT